MNDRIRELEEEIDAMDDMIVSLVELLEERNHNSRRMERKNQP